MSTYGSGVRTTGRENGRVFTLYVLLVSVVVTSDERFPNPDDTDMSTVAVWPIARTFIR
jgi:hypothetical protein